MYSSDASQLRIAIDMNYDHLMTDKVAGEAITGVCVIMVCVQGYCNVSETMPALLFWKQTSN